VKRPANARPFLAGFFTASLRRRRGREIPRARYIFKVIRPSDHGQRATAVTDERVELLEVVFVRRPRSRACCLHEPGITWKPNVFRRLPVPAVLITLFPCDEKLAKARIRRPAVRRLISRAVQACSEIHVRPGLKNNETILKSIARVDGLANGLAHEVGRAGQLERQILQKVGVPLVHPIELSLVADPVSPSSVVVEPHKRDDPTRGKMLVWILLKRDLARRSGSSRRPPPGQARCQATRARTSIAALRIDH